MKIMNFYKWHSTYMNHTELNLDLSVKLKEGRRDHFFISHLQDNCDCKLYLHKTFLELEILIVWLQTNCSRNLVVITPLSVTPPSPTWLTETAAGHRGLNPLVMFSPHFTSNILLLINQTFSDHLCIKEFKWPCANFSKTLQAAWSVPGNWNGLKLFIQESSKFVVCEFTSLSSTSSWGAVLLL